MTTSHRLDAIQMAKQRHRPLEDTPASSAYAEMLREFAAFQNVLVQANPRHEQMKHLTASLSQLRRTLEECIVPESERWYGRG